MMDRRFAQAAMMSGVLLSGCSRDAEPAKAPAPAIKRTVGEAVRSLLFREINPPSKLFPPGTLVRLTSEATTGVAAMDLVCPAKDVLGRDPDEISSPSTNDVAQRMLSNSFDAGVDVLNIIKANTKFHDIQDVRLSLTNTSIKTIPIAMLLEAKPANFCIEAAKRLGSLYVITSVLQADVRYRIAFDSSVSAETRAALTTELAANLSGAVSAQGENELSGQQLYWGERGNSDLVSVLRDAKAVPPTGPNCKRKDPEGYCTLCDLTATEAQLTAIAEGQSAMALSCDHMRVKSEVEVSASGQVWPSNNGKNPDNDVVWLIAHLTGTAGTVTYQNGAHKNRTGMSLSTSTTVPETGRVDAAVTVSHVQTWPNEHGPMSLEPGFKVVVRSK
jgi:hypothetical protein